MTTFKYVVIVYTFASKSVRYSNLRIIVKTKRWTQERKKNGAKSKNTPLPVCSFVDSLRTTLQRKYFYLLFVDVHKLGRRGIYARRTTKDDSKRKKSYYYFTSSLSRSLIRVRVFVILNFRQRNARSHSFIAIFGYQRFKAFKNVFRVMYICIIQMACINIAGGRGKLRLMYTSLRYYTA